MTKNLKKCLNLLRAGRPITEARFPTNYQLAMDIVYGPETGVIEENVELLTRLADNEPMTESDFHQAHSVEKEQV